MYHDTLTSAADLLPPDAPATPELDPAELEQAQANFALCMSLAEFRSDLRNLITLLVTAAQRIPPTALSYQHFMDLSVAARIIPDAPPAENVFGPVRDAIRDFVAAAVRNELIAADDPTLTGFRFEG